MSQRGALALLVDERQLSGRLTFSRDEVKDELGVTGDAVKQAVLRLAKHRRVVSPRRGFYVIVPLEDRERGAPALERWLPELLRHQGVRASETVVDGDEVLVSVDRAQRPMTCGSWRVRFQVRGRG